MDINNIQSFGRLRISVISGGELRPIAGAQVTIAYTEEPSQPVFTGTTDISGETEEILLTAPDFGFSQEPSEIQPYTDYNITVEAEGYEPALVSGTEILPDRLALQQIRLIPMERTEEEQIVVIPVHTLFGDYPPKLPEDEIKPMAETGEIVLSRVVIPEYVIVHDGLPSDNTVQNYWVRYKDYIKNVASCEIYATWPEAALYASIQNGTEIRVGILLSHRLLLMIRSGFMAEIFMRILISWWIMYLQIIYPDRGYDSLF